MGADPTRRRRRGVRALGLLSGGLDSTVAAGVLQDQGVEVEGVHFSTGFCKVEHRRALGRERDVADPRRIRNEALRAGADLEAPVEVVDVAEEFLREVVLRPRHGYGAAMNPCIDCRIFMLRKAGEIARERGADVVFTGEVLGQRPMSQNRGTMDPIERESGLAGRLLRPQSAGYFPPTEAERDGRIDRERLPGIHGRGRREQIALAGRLGIREFPAPSGGCCYLADANFARRLRDLVRHRGRSAVRPADIVMLKVGRHFRLAPDLKVILGRDEAESTFLRLRSSGCWTGRPADGRGTFARIEGEPDAPRRLEIAGLVARYSRHRDEPEVDVELCRGERTLHVRVAPAARAWARERLL